MVDERRRVAITGIGLVVPAGIGVKAGWELLTFGRTATRQISLFDATDFRSRIAAEVDFDPAAEGLSPQEIRRMDRAAQFAVVTTREALCDAGVDDIGVPPERIGVSFGSAVGCTMGLEQEYIVLSDGGANWLVDPDYRVPHLYGYMVPSTIACEVAWASGAQGPVGLISTGCTAGLDAVGYGAQLIWEGSADVVVAGATDAPISPITSACILAPRSRYQETVDALAGMVSGLSVGDPADPATQIGPLVAKRQQDRVEGYISIGQDEGAKIVTGGSRASGQERGWYVAPTVFADVDPGMRIAREEIFGPVLAVIPYEDTEHAIKIANDSDYGLAGTVWTSDADQGMRIARRVRTGTYGVNMYMIETCAPFGGYKASGIGRELGPEGLMSYLEYKSIATPAT